MTARAVIPFPRAVRTKLWLLTSSTAARVVRMIAAPMPRLRTSAGKKICWKFSQGSLVEARVPLRRGEVVEVRREEGDERGAEDEARHAEPDHGDALADLVTHLARACSAPIMPKPTPISRPSTSETIESSSVTGAAWPISVETGC